MLWWLARSRGLRWRVILNLFAAVAVAGLASRVAVQLRTAEARDLVGPVLDSGVLVGLVLPVVVLSSLVEDRSAWLAVTSPRSAIPRRAAWLAWLLAGTLAIGVGITALLPGQVSAALVLADFVLLFGLALGGSVILGRQLGWTVPAAVALVFSTPGLIPIDANWLALAHRAPDVMGVAGALIAAFSALFIAVDEYGLDRYRRVFERMPGVVDD